MQKVAPGYSLVKTCGNIVWTKAIPYACCLELKGNIFKPNKHEESTRRFYKMSEIKSALT